MSVEIAQYEIERFLREPQPEVLVIKGDWGVGKTYSWQNILSKAKKKEELSCSRYTYVSLFGIGSLDSFKYALFEQALPAEMIGQAPTIETLKDNAKGLSETLGRKALGLFRGASLLRDFVPAIESLSFLSVQNMLICVDDIERRGDNLPIKDILGVVSLLKEQKSCKVVLILNETEQNLEEYKKYKEKAIDVGVEFSPTSSECVDIALNDDTPFEENIRKNCINLGINNIRLIKKIERLVGRLIPIISGYEEDLIHKAVHSIVLYSWCLYSGPSEGVPDVDYVISRGYSLFGIEEENKEEKKKRWDSIIRSYGYHSTDELDLVLAESVKSGFFVEGQVSEKAYSKNQKIIAGNAQKSFAAAWELFHNNFNATQEEVVEALYASLKNNFEHISPLNVDGTVRLFRELGEDKKANDIIEFYIDRRRDNPELFDLSRSPFSEEIRDARLRERFAEVYEDTRKLPDAWEVLDKLVGQNGWDGTDERVLSETSVDDYYEIFMSETGAHLSEYVRICLRFGEFSNASERQMEIARRAREALERIGRISPINRIKVKKFGVDLENDV